VTIQVIGEFLLEVDPDISQKKGMRILNSIPVVRTRVEKQDQKAEFRHRLHAIQDVVVCSQPGRIRPQQTLCPLWLRVIKWIIRKIRF
jgi:hypothetical protein